VGFESVHAESPREKGEVEVMAIRHKDPFGRRPSLGEALEMKKRQDAERKKREEETLRSLESQLREQKKQGRGRGQ